MIKFSEFLTEAKAQEGKLLHMDHLEEEIFNGGIVGIRGALNYLRGVRDLLAGDSTKKVNVTVKFDGAPSIVTGINPDNGRFFVATKSAFNVSPKLYYSEAEIDKGETGDKGEKMKLLFRYLKDIGIKGVVQGDFMFAQDTLKTQTINGESYLTFQPNTIIYAVPSDSALAKEIRSKKIGIVFHTQYTGNTFANLKASFGYDISTLKPSKNAWVKDAYFRDESGTANLDAHETLALTNILSNAGKTFNKIDPDFVNHIAANEDLKIAIKSYDNSKIRAGQTIDNIKVHVQGLIKWISERHDNKISAVKTAASKAPKQTIKDQELKLVRANIKQFELLYSLYTDMQQAKAMLIDKLKQVKGLGTFLKDANGFKVTDPEGFVAIDNLSGKAVKLVDRMSFSRANFDPTIAKGWQRE